MTADNITAFSLIAGAILAAVTLALVKIHTDVMPAIKAILTDIADIRTTALLARQQGEQNTARLNGQSAKLDAVKSALSQTPITAPTDPLALLNAYAAGIHQAQAQTAPEKAFTPAVDTPKPPDTAPALAPLPDPFGPGQSAEDHGTLDLGANRPVSPSLVIPVAVDPPVTVVVPAPPVVELPAPALAPPPPAVELPPVVELPPPVVEAPPPVVEAPQQRPINVTITADAPLDAAVIQAAHAALDAQAIPAPGNAPAPADTLGAVQTATAGAADPVNVITAPPPASVIVAQPPVLVGAATAPVIA